MAASSAGPWWIAGLGVTLLIGIADGVWCSKKTLSTGAPPTGAPLAVIPAGNTAPSGPATPHFPVATFASLEDCQSGLKRRRNCQDRFTDEGQLKISLSVRATDQIPAASKHVSVVVEGSLSSTEIGQCLQEALIQTAEARPVPAGLATWSTYQELDIFKTP